MSNIQDNLSHLQHRIQSACKRAGRNPKEIRLLLATKTVDAHRIGEAMAAGVTLMGENKVQELKQKCAAVSTWHPEVHFIGHLQTNKIKEVIKWASCIQSLDRWSLAEKLDKRLQLEGKSMEVYIQVNTSYEASKFGLAPEDVLPFVKKVATLQTLHIKGLMTIGLLSSKPHEVRPCFKLLRTIQQDIMALRLPGVSVDTLSMGMSGDLEIAIEEGATMVRVGTAIFGERIYPDSYYWDESITPAP